MIGMSPTFSQIKAQVAAVREKIPSASVVGIHSTGRWSGPEHEHDGEDSYLIQQCDSPLAFRQALRRPVADDTIKVVITSLEDTQLGEDILVRLAKRRLFQINSWQIVPALFQAHAVDPRLSQQSWIADVLLEQIPPEGYPPARGGFLDAETVWPVLLRQMVGLAADPADLNSLLKWSLDQSGVIRFRQTNSQFQDGAIGWLVEKAGAAAEMMLRHLIQSDRCDAVPLGIAAGVVFHRDTAGKIDRAIGRFESRFLDGRTPDPHQMLRWCAAATEVVRTLRHTDPKSYHRILARADEILSDVQADAFAHVSDTSALGFEQRLQLFGQLLSEITQSPSRSHLAKLQAAQESIRRHDQASRDSMRLSRVHMSLRLARWLAIRELSPSGRDGQEGSSDVAAPQSLADAANRHLSEGGFVDWARLSLRAGDPNRELSEAYARLFATVTEVREQHAQQFATLLVDWTAAGSQGSELVPVERILEEIVAPLAAQHPVLVLVIDGMSVAVCHELLADLTRHEWMALSEPGRVFNRPGLATIPSVTEYSRTSLLCGRLRQGSAAQEVAEFESHPALVKVSRAGSPPKLFHKRDLREGDDAIVSKDVRDAIQSTHRKVVGVVVNAVDDHLAKGEQIDVSWSREAIKVLPALLQEARMARRLVVLVSDHGHVLDTGTTERKSDGGERWRVIVGEPQADELHVRGSRVLVNGQQLIAPWTERVRYASKKNGYHGGLSPQEMVIPIVVLASSDDVPDGWQEQPVATPSWWDETTPVSLRSQSVPRVLKPAKTKSTGKLFEVEANGEVTPVLVAKVVVASAPQQPEWISRLLASPVFEQQKVFGGRAIPSNAEIAKLLTLLDERGGKLLSTALARALQLPALRLPGLLSKVQRVLNIDGYQVLHRDDASDTIELNRELLLTQFDLV